MIFTSIYYIFFASSVILYGAGFNNLTIVCDSIHELKLSFAKVMFSILITCILSFQFMHFFLIPLRLVEFYPLIALIIFLIISTILETVVRITTGKITSEFIFSYLLILLALNESLNLTEVIIISIGGFISFALLIPAIYSIKKRVSIIGNQQPHGNKKSMVLISIAIIVMILAVGNVSWFSLRG